MYFFVGTYNQPGSPASTPMGAGIISCFFNSNDGSIEVISSCFQRNPSYPVVSADGKILYVASEMFATEKPMLIAYEILDDGSLYKLNHVTLTGDYACHLAIVHQNILVANYVSGDILAYAIEEDGSIGRMLQRIQHYGSGTNKNRQEAPHPHMIYPVDDLTAYCVDLGIDTAKAYRVDVATGKWKSHPNLDIRIKDGAGARHMAMDAHKQRMLVLGELSGELFFFTRLHDCFQLTNAVLLGEDDMSAAAITIHNNGRFVFCSERKTNCIYAFGITNEKLQPIGKFNCGGSTPRDISIDPTGRWLLAANQDDNNIAVFSIDLQTGALAFVHSCPISTPSCICWQKKRYHLLNKKNEISSGQL